MGLTLTQLIEAKTKEQLFEELLLAMRGVGYVFKEGEGEGSLRLSGVAAAAYLVVVKVVLDGPLGTAKFRYSLDAGRTYNGADILVPSAGSYALGTTGVTLLFQNGPGDAVDSFITGDKFSFELSVPTLPTTSWHSGSTARTILAKDSEANEDLAASVQALAKGAYLSSAEGPWLDLWMEELYDLERDKGQVAQHSVNLFDGANAGPFTIVPGQLVVSTATGLRFSNVAGGTLPLGGTLTLAFAAEQRGTAYNVAVGAINLLLTSLPGVSVTNPDLGSGSSVTTQGKNVESASDARARAKLRWGTLGSGAVADSYELWATQASANVTRALPKPDPAVAGGVLVLLAGPAGPVDTGVGGTVDVVNAALQPRVPLGSVLTTATALATPIAISGTVYVRAGYGSSALAAIQANLIALFQGGVNSIGESLSGIDISDGTVKVYRSDLIEQIQIVEGVRNVDLATLLPAGDTTLADAHVATLSPTPAFTIVEV